MFKRFKQRLDAWAIRMAAKTLPPPLPRPNQLAEVAGMLADPAFFDPPGTIPVIKAGRSRNGIAGQFQFTSTVETGFPTSDLAHGWFLAAGEDWRSKPLIVLIHGWNAELHYHYLLPKLARQLVRAGWNAAALELPFHSHRRPSAPGRIRNFISDDIPVTLMAARQAIADMESLLRWFRNNGCPKVALWGFSLGAWLAGLHLTVSRTADTAILTTPVSNLKRAVRELEFCFPIRAALRDGELDLARLNLFERQPLISRDRILLHQANYDLFIPEGEYEELHRSWGMQRCRDDQSHISVLLSRQSAARCIAWLNSAGNH